MAMAMASVHDSGGTMKIPIPQTKRHFAANSTSYLALPRAPLSRSVLTLARRRSNAGRPVSKKNKSPSKADVGKDNDLDEDAFEALFKQLEEDLKKDEESLGDGEDDISEEELAMLERELEEALAEDEDLSELLNLMAGDSNGGGIDNDEQKEELVNYIEVDNEEEEKEDDDEEEPVKLKGWQLRQLAKALKVGRRKTSIKSLAAELCLDREVVLKMLRDPPPSLLMMSAALPDRQEPTTTTTAAVTVPESEATTPSEVIDDVSKPEPKEETPIHVLQGSWSAQKRIKKAHINTLETVYRRTKRPTNTMISSIVQVTNLPRRRVVKWFEDKRDADGVPQERRPYQPSPSVFAN